MPLSIKKYGDPKNEAIIFLHGFLGSQDDWKEIISELDKEFYCVAIDLPGHGSSINISTPLENGFDYCNHLIENAINQLQLKKYILVGYSLGGRIALNYLKDKKDLNLKGLILESAHFGLVSSVEKNQRLKHDERWAKLFAIQNIEFTLSQWYQQKIFDDLTEDEQYDLIQKRKHNYGVYLANMLLSTSLSKQENNLETLKNNKLPTIYICGEKDQKYCKLSEQLNGIETLKLAQFEGAGHNVHQYNPLKYAKYIKEFISSIKTK